MVWTIVFLIIISLIKVLPTVLPLGAVEWMMNKFATHTKLSEQKVTIIIEGKQIEDKDKTNFIQYFNEAIFMEKYYIYPGTEHTFLPPERKGSPIIIDTQNGKVDLKLYLFNDRNSVDVVKVYKKKVIAYNIHSEKVQEYFKTKAAI